MSDISSEDAAIQRLEAGGLSGTLEEMPESLRQLISQAERETVAWRPDAGDVVAGVLRDISDSAEGDFGSYPIIVIETPKEVLVSVHCFHTVLRREIERKLARGILKIGDEIAVFYAGEGVSKGGREAPQLYRVAVNRP